MRASDGKKAKQLFRRRPLLLLAEEDSAALRDDCASVFLTNFHLESVRGGESSSSSPSSSISARAKSDSFCFTFPLNDYEETFHNLARGRTGPALYPYFSFSSV